METNYTLQIGSALLATTFYPKAGYSWFGQHVYRVPASVRRNKVAEFSRNSLLKHLQKTLYTNFYCPGKAVPPRNAAPVTRRDAASLFLKNLSAANKGKGHQDIGWIVESSDELGVTVRKHGLRLRVQSRDCFVEDGQDLIKGQIIAIRWPKELFETAPGFYTAIGNQPSPSEGIRSIVRFYWNLKPKGAIELVRYTTKYLNASGMAFRLKVLNDSARYNRCDSGVLYLDKIIAEKAKNTISLLYAKVAPHLKQSVPAFTRKLAPGLAMADDPGNGESFGMNRCRLLADGMISAHEKRSGSLEDRIQVVEARFLKENVSINRPYLKNESQDDLRFQLRYESPAHVINRLNASVELDLRRVLAVAIGIGEILCREAIWHDQYCTWIGKRLGSDGHKGRLNATSHETLGPNLYAGSSGVAWFLAELAIVTGDKRVRKTALGAIRHSLARAEFMHDSLRLGSYVGWLGIALSAARIGTLFGEQCLLKQATRLMKRALSESSQLWEPDMMGGNAGAIVSILVLRRILDSPDLLAYAIRLGDELLQRAWISEIGRSWKSEIHQYKHDLTGFSHGTAGIGYALLELFKETEEVRYRDAAEDAFRYERHWFNDKAANWPDFRQEARKAKRKPKRRSFTLAWCHGAPGIAISRLHGYQITNSKVCLHEAKIALQTTAKAVQSCLTAEEPDFSLCHGLAGNTDILLYGNQVLGDGAKERVRLVTDAVNFGVNRYLQQKSKWLCGSVSGQNPSLMVGLSGVGLLFLRFYCKTLPTPLALHTAADDT